MCNCAVQIPILSAPCLHRMVMTIPARSDEDLAWHGLNNTARCFQSTRMETAHAHTARTRSIVWKQEVTTLAAVGVAGTAARCRYSLYLHRAGLNPAWTAVQQCAARRSVLLQSFIAPLLYRARYYDRHRRQLMQRSMRSAPTPR